METPIPIYTTNFSINKFLIFLVLLWSPSKNSEITSVVYRETRETIIEITSSERFYNLRSKWPLSEGKFQASVQIVKSINQT